MRVSERTQVCSKHGSFCNKCEAGGTQFHSLCAMANWRGTALSRYLPEPVPLRSKAAG